MNALRSCFFLCFIFIATDSFSLDGWELSDGVNIRSYIPSDIASGKVLTYVATGPYELNSVDLKHWFSKRSREMQDLLGEPMREWTVTSNNEGWFSFNTYFDKKNNINLSAAYQGGMLDSERAYVVILISSLDEPLVEKYGSKFGSVLSDAKQYLSAQPTISGGTASTAQQVEKKPGKQNITSKSEPKNIEEAIRVASGKGADIDDIEIFWIDRYWNVLMGTESIDTHLLFKDGTAYKECTIPPDELDVVASKRLEPQNWTTWRKQRGTYQLKDKDAWYDLEGAPVIKAPDNMVISGDFFNAGGSSNAGAWETHIIFYDDGRFERTVWAIQTNENMGGGSAAPLIGSMVTGDKHGSEGATVVAGTRNSNGADVSGGATSQSNDGSRNRGHYEIKDYTITMKHDDGYTHTELFLYEKQAEVTTFVYGDGLYWLDD
jgi:hypothetical protein